MKIFNWVHRRFHQKDEVGRDVKKVEFVKNNTDTNDKLALLEHVALANALDVWKDGILTIGTLGLDPLKNMHQTKGYFLENENNYLQQEHNDSCDDIFGEENGYDHKIDEEGERETDPLVLKAFEHGYGSHFDHEITVEGTDHDHDHDPDRLHTCKYDLSDPKPNDEVGGSYLESEEEMKRKRPGERITLADLFSADSDMKKRHDHEKDVADNFGKSAANHHAKKGISSFSKKFIPRVKEDSRPIQKLHKLMTKMLKRKIHPDLESKISFKETQLGVVSKDELGGMESLSLLQAQVAST